MQHKPARIGRDNNSRIRINVNAGAPVYAMTKEEALAKLNERYDRDEITEEEYQRERMNIINNV